MIDAGTTSASPPCGPRVSKGSTDSDASCQETSNSSIKLEKSAEPTLLSCKLRDPVIHTPLKAPNGITSPQLRGATRRPEATGLVLN